MTENDDNCTHEKCEQNKNVSDSSKHKRGCVVATM